MEMDKNRNAASGAYKVDLTDVNSLLVWDTSGKNWKVKLMCTAWLSG